LANNAPPIELFFGHVVVAAAERHAGDRAAFDASRTLALRCYETIAPDERTWCEKELKELEG